MWAEEGGGDAPPARSPGENWQAPQEFVFFAKDTRPCSLPTIYTNCLPACPSVWLAQAWGRLTGRQVDKKRMRGSWAKACLEGERSKVMGFGEIWNSASLWADLAWHNIPVSRKRRSAPVKCHGFQGRYVNLVPAVGEIANTVLCHKSRPIFRDISRCVCPLVI